MTITLTPLPGIPIIRPGDDLAETILAALSAFPAGSGGKPPLQDGDILVLAQKIVSKAEGRLVNLNTVTPSPHARQLAAKTGKDPRLAELILSESSEVLRTRPGLIIVEHRQGFVCANAGIDHSNVSSPLPREDGLEVRGNPEDWYLLLPEDPDRSAAKIRAKLESATGVRLGVLIIDSHGRAWREGTVGTTIGLSGLPALVDKRGDHDLFGYALKVTVIGVADELAAAASLVMGQADEGTPVVHVRGFPYPLTEDSLPKLIRPKEQDLFR